MSCRHTASETGQERKLGAYLRVPQGTALAACLFCVGLRAQSAVELELSSQVSYGDPVMLTVRVVNPASGMGVPSLPPVKGLRIEGPWSAGTEQSLIQTGGRTVIRSTRRYQWRITPEAGTTGTFTIGPVTVSQRQGGPLRSRTVQLAVYRRPNLALRFTCELARSEGEVGAPVKATYTLAYPSGALSDSPSLTELPIVNLPGVKVRPVRAFAGRPADRAAYGSTYLLVQKDVVSQPDGSAYEALCFAFEITPLRTGTIKIPAASARAPLKTGRWRLERDFFFGTRRVPEVREFQARTQELTYRVRPLPEEGRPAGFSGAVGRFTIEVDTKDREVNCFDPIRLTVKIRGEGLLEEVTLPSWQELPELREDFDISTDVDPGKIEAGAKVFHQTIRPLKDTITAIPPLPFPYYDPYLKKYVVALSAPIPIVVHPTRTVTAKDAYRKEPPLAVRKANPRPASQPVIVEQEGVGANFRQIGTVRGYLRSGDLVLSWPFLLASVGSPLFFALVLGALYLTRQDPAEKAKRSAFRWARAALSAAGEDPEAVCEAFQKYFRDRFFLPPGEVTPDQVQEVLQRNGIGPDLARRAAEHLHSLLEVRFSGAGGAGDGTAAPTLQILREVERCAQR